MIVNNMCIVIFPSRRFKTGLQGAAASQLKSPRVKPFLRMASSTDAGTVKPWIIDASTARYIAYDVFQIFQPAVTPGSPRMWWAEAMLMHGM